MQQLNPYDPDKFEKDFSFTELYRMLLKDFDIVYFSTAEDLQTRWLMTPREREGYRWFSAKPFYYMNILLEEAPTTVADIGCGWNIFKKYIPNIIGYAGGSKEMMHMQYRGKTYIRGDVLGNFDDEFVQNHLNHFESVYAINSLHFIPLSGFLSRLQQFYDVISPGGSGWITFKSGIMIEQEPNKSQVPSDIDAYIRGELIKFDAINSVTWKVIDIDVGHQNSYMEGDISLLFKK